MKSPIKILTLVALFFGAYHLPLLSSGGLPVAIVAQAAAPTSQAPKPSSPATARFVPRQPICAGCLAAYGTNKRRDCVHSFCVRCYTSAVIAECPTCTEEANQCAICLDLFDNSVKTLVCGHMFCANCIASWQATQAAHELTLACPSCREPLEFKEKVHCDICKQVFKDRDEITPPMVCKLIGWAMWREKYVCVKQNVHRFHDTCFMQHYIKPGQHTSDSRGHTCICPVHAKIERCAQHPDRCSMYDHPWGHIKLPQILPDRGGPTQYVEYTPVEPTQDRPSPRTAKEAEDMVFINERNEFLAGKMAPAPEGCAIL